MCLCDATGSGSGGGWSCGARILMKNISWNFVINVKIVLFLKTYLRVRLTLALVAF